MLSCALYNLTCVVHNFSIRFDKNGKPMKGQPVEAFHPFRSDAKDSSEKLRLTRQNFHVLRQIFVQE